MSEYSMPPEDLLTSPSSIPCSKPSLDQSSKFPDLVTLSPAATCLLRKSVPHFPKPRSILFYTVDSSLQSLRIVIFVPGLERRDTNSGQTESISLYTNLLEHLRWSGLDSLLSTEGYFQTFSGKSDRNIVQVFLSLSSPSSWLRS